MTFRLVAISLLLSAIALSACSGRGTSNGVYYGNRVAPGPWYGRGMYVRDRVHVVSEEEIRAVEEVTGEPEHMSDPLIDTPDMGGGDFDMEGFDHDF